MRFVRFNEHMGRSLIKAITFRILIVIANGIIVYSLTHQYDTTASIMFLSSVSSTALYLIHERVWNNIHWGKEEADIKRSLK